MYKYFGISQSNTATENKLHINKNISEKIEEYLNKNNINNNQNYYYNKFCYLSLNRKK